MALAQTSHGRPTLPLAGSAGLRDEQAVEADDGARRQDRVAGSLLVTFSIHGIGLVTGIMVARMLGVEGRGELAAVILWASVITYLGDLGLPVAYAYEAARDGRRVPALIGNALIASVSQWLALSAIGVPLVLLVLDRYGAEVALLAAGFLVTFLPLNLFVRYLNSINQGLGRFFDFNLVRLSVHVAYLAILVALTLAGLQSVLWVLAATIAANVVTLAVVLRLSLPRLLADWGRPQIDLPFMGRTVVYGAKAHLGHLTPIDTMHLDLLLVTAFLSSGDAGLYAVALGAAALVRSQGWALGTVALPEVAACASQQQRRVVTGEIFRLALIMTSLSAAALALAAGLLVPLIYGEAFVSATPTLRILLLGVVAAALRQVLADCLRGAGRPGASTVAEMASWGIALPGLLILLPAYGLSGAAAALSASYGAALAITIWLALREGMTLSQLFVPRTADVKGLLRLMGRIVPRNRLQFPLRSPNFAPMLGSVTTVVTLLAAFLGAGLAVVIIRPSDTWLLIAAIGACTTGPVLYRVWRGRFDLFEPLTIACIAMGMMFVARPIALLIDGDKELRTYDFSSTFDQALLIALSGCAAFIAGYALPFGRRLAGRSVWANSGFHADTVVSYAIAIFLVGMVLETIFVVQSGGWSYLLSQLEGQRSADGAIYRSSTAYLYQGALLCVPSSLLLLASGFITKRRGLIVLAVLVMVPLIMTSGFSGGRLHLMMLLASPVIFAFIHAARRPSFWTSTITIFLVLTVGIGFLKEQRDAETRTETRLEILERSVTHPEDILESLVLGADTEMFDTLAVELDTVPDELSYKHGAVATDLLTRAVPRTLWPDKPLDSNDRLVDFLFPQQFSVTAAAPASSLVGSLFLDSGWPTVVAGMFAVGVAARALWSWLKRSPQNLSTQLTFALSLPLIIVLLRGNLPHTLSIASYTILPLLVGLRLAAHKVRAGSRHGAMNANSDRPGTKAWSQGGIT